MKKKFVYIIVMLLVFLAIGAEIPLLFLLQKSANIYHQYTISAANNKQYFVFSQQDFNAHKINKHEIIVDAVYYDFEIISTTRDSIKISAQRDKAESIIALLFNEIHQQKNKKAKYAIHDFLLKIGTAPVLFTFTAIKINSFPSVICYKTQKIDIPFIAQPTNPPDFFL